MFRISRPFFIKINIKFRVIRQAELGLVQADRRTWRS